MGFPIRINTGVNFSWKKSHFHQIGAPHLSFNLIDVGMPIHNVRFIPDFYLLVNVHVNVDGYIHDNADLDEYFLTIKQVPEIFNYSGCRMRRNNKMADIKTKSSLDDLNSMSA